MKNFFNKKLSFYLKFWISFLILFYIFSGFVISAYTHWGYSSLKRKIKFINDELLRVKENMVDFGYKDTALPNWAIKWMKKHWDGDAIYDFDFDRFPHAVIKYINFFCRMFDYKIQLAKTLAELNHIYWKMCANPNMFDRLYLNTIDLYHNVYWVFWLFLLWLIFGLLEWIYSSWVEFIKEQKKKNL